MLIFVAMGHDKGSGWWRWVAREKLSTMLCSDASSGHGSELYRGIGCGHGGEASYGAEGWGRRRGSERKLTGSL